MKRFCTYLFLIATVFFAASASVSAQNRDSLWISMVSDSSLVIRPELPDTVSTVPETIDSLATFLARQDSILLAERIADSLRVEREDSLARVMSRVDELVLNGEDCIEHYSYGKAIEFFSQALEICSDTLAVDMLQTEIDRCSYALRNTVTVQQPDVVARQQFSIDDFYLYYPLPDKSWHDVDGTPPMYLEEDRDVVHVSRDFEMIYQMTFGDRMYFSSKELDGFGGYDLFCCEWDDKLEEWGEPKNLGFPYSSAGDDFLFVETADGRYSIFASNRDSGDNPDSVYVYVIDRIASPKEIDNPTSMALERIARLEPKEGLRQIDNIGNAETNALDNRYREIVERERELRHMLENADSEEHPSIQAELDLTMKEKDRVKKEITERSSLRERISNESDHEVVGLDGAFLFTKKTLGKRIKVIYD